MTTNTSTKQKKKQIVFTLEYRVDIEENIDIQVQDLLEKGRESGSCGIVDVRIEEVPK